MNIDIQILSKGTLEKCVLMFDLVICLRFLIRMFYLAHNMNIFAERHFEKMYKKLISKLVKKRNLIDFCAYKNSYNKNECDKKMRSAKTIVKV